MSLFWELYLHCGIYPSQEPCERGTVIDCFLQRGTQLRNGQVSLKGHRAQEAVEQDFNSVQLGTITVPRAETDCVKAVETVKEQAQENFYSKQEVKSRKVHMRLLNPKSSS